jgi:leucyl aminopeptidase (aminopeptidase T)
MLRDMSLGGDDLIDKRKIEKGTVNMLKINLGLKAREKLLVVTDAPTIEEWKSHSSEKLADAVRRSVLAREVSEIAAQAFPQSSVEFFAYPSIGKHGTYPGNEVEERMKAADVVVAMTTYSLTHTDAREHATQAGARLASMPMFLAEMFYPGGAMAADYRKIAGETKRIADLITQANEATIKSRAGTDFTFSVEGRKGMSDSGIFTEKGAWGNLPSGEAYCAPLEGTGNGKVVVQKGWYPDLKENMIISFKDGKVTSIEGGGQVGDRFRELLAFGKEEEPYLSRRNHAELGVGTNPNAKRPDNVLEAEKIRGTVHVAIGDNSHMGGSVKADLHQDFIIPLPTFSLDNQVVMRNGRLVI